MPVRQIVSSPTLLAYGCYDYFELSLHEAIDWLAQGEYYSTMRSRDMCFALHDLTGRNIYPLSGAPQPPLLPAEEALVFYIKLSETVRTINNMSRDYMLENYQLGLLKRVDVVPPDGEDEEAETEATVETAVQRCATRSGNVARL